MVAPGLYLKRLEVFGFKSFADRTTLEFGPGVTAVVGPNGSGKSNITEAIRWVLGEQSPKQLRGSRMEDVIFAGTERRRPVGFCEVSLTLDNSDRILPVDFTEVTVTRRVDRGGAGEYLINGVSCRLKDVLELFADTGLGREGYYTISQGRIDEVLTHRPEDRRGLFEEAAGIVRYKLRKREAQAKLEETGAALLRLGDVLAELDQQVQHLAEQAQRAKRYQALAGELAGLEIAAWLEEWDQAENRLTATRGERESAQAEAARAAAELAQAEAAQETDRVRLLEVEQRLSAAQAGRLEWSERRSRCRGRQDVVRERLQTVQRDLERLQAEGAQAEAKLLESAGRAAQLEQRQGELAAERETVTAAWSAAQHQAKEHAAGVQRYAAELAQAQELQLDLARRISDRQGWLGSGQKGAAEMAQRLAKVREDRAAAEERKAQAALAVQAAQKTLEQLEQQLEALQARGAQIAARMDQERGRLAAAESGERRRREELGALRSRLRLLEELHREMEGYQRGVRDLLQAAEHDQTLAQGLIGVVAELLRVPAEYEKAIETALGGGLQNIITETDAAAQRAIAWLKQHQAGRVTFLPLNTLRPSVSRPGEWSGMDAPGVIGPALELVQFEPRLQPAFAFLLGRTVVCRDLKAGLALGKRNDFRFRVVTLDGDQVNPGGSLTGGSTGNGRGAGLLGRERERVELAGQVAELAKAVEQAAADVASARAALSRLEQEQAALVEERHRTQVALAQAERDLGRHRDEQHYFDEQAGRFELEELELTAQASGGSRLAEQWQRELQALEAEAAALAERMAAATAAQQEAAQAREQALAEATAQQVRLAAMQQEAAGLLQELEREQRQQRELADRIAAGAAQREELEQSLGAAQTELVTLQQEEQEIDHQLNSLKESLSAESGERQALADTVAERERTLRALRLTQTEAQARLARAEQEIARNEVLRDQAAGRLLERYQLAVEEARLRLASAGAGAAGTVLPAQRAERISALRRQIDALGPVNLTAVEEFEQASTRQQFLQQQCQDLEQAQAALRGAIAELDGRIRERFLTTFETIRGHFREMFTRFFGGGRADLQLVEAEDLLESGVEIVAQPPGKKLQVLSLLSGGERALTAIALQFAVLLVKPAPFCVLDEIEAALDDANVERFARALREFGRNTQFIVVTHQKGTMAAADVLYGVTMEEQGVSKLVSVRLAS